MFAKTSDLKKNIMLFNSDALAALKKINKPFKGMDHLLLTLSVSILQNSAIVVNTFFTPSWRVAVFDHFGNFACDINFSGSTHKMAAYVVKVHSVVEEIIRTSRRSEKGMNEKIGD